MITTTGLSSSLRHFTARYQMAIFVVLTYLLSWALVIPLEGGLLPHGPMIAAFVILAIISGRKGVAGLWQQMTRWRVDWKWYLIAPGIIIAAHLGALAASQMLRLQIVNTAHLRSLPVFLGTVVSLVFLGGQWEEPGWLAYALRRFQARFAAYPLMAVFAAGLIRMVWHTPLLLYGTIPWFDYIFYSFSLQIMVAWLYNRTHGSVLIPMLCHLFSNVIFAMAIPLFGDAHQEQYLLLLVIAAGVIALGIVIATRGKLGLQPERGHVPAFSNDI